MVNSWFRFTNSSHGQKKVLAKSNTPFCRLRAAMDAAAVGRSVEALLALGYGSRQLGQALQQHMEQRGQTFRHTDCVHAAGVSKLVWSMSGPVAAPCRWACGARVALATLTVRRLVAGGVFSDCRRFA